MSAISTRIAWPRLHRPALAGWRADIAGVLLLAVAFTVTLKLSPWSTDVANDFGLYRLDGHAFLSGVLPYRGLFFEYPPGAAPLMMLPQLGNPGLWRYVHLFALEMLAWGVVLVVSMRRAAALSGAGPALAAAAIGISPLLIGAVERSRFDLAPVALAAVALALLLADRPSLSMAVLGVAVVVKGFPLVAAPVALAWIWARSGSRPALRAAGAGAAVVGVVMGAAFLISPHGLLDSIRFQVGRPVQLESTPASVLIALGHLGVIAHPFAQFGHRQFGLVAAHATLVGLVVKALGLLTIGGLVAGITRRPGHAELMLAFGASLAAYATFSNGFSPQYIIWSLPLFAVAVAQHRTALAIVLAAAMVLTLAEYAHFSQVVALVPRWTWVIAARNLLCAASAWMALWFVVRSSGRGSLSGDGAAGAHRAVGRGRPAAAGTLPG